MPGFFPHFGYRRFKGRIETVDGLSIAAGTQVSIDIDRHAGYLRFRVSPSDVTVDYVRVYLPAASPSGKVAYTYKIVPDSIPARN